ncbi:MAG: LacI family DNA-binding transcriptional regulator [Anaerolineae bacterium]|jgi:DNA-binding LacI/PurR family transcriptional regulator|nr:LacI family DNA-binding transcriptional regulator [Anaerolineae bacterium]
MEHKKHTPTIKDVARMAGVSIATVSRTINGIDVVNEETVQRVRAAISELNYIPSSAARMLASRKTSTIGLLVPEISGAFFQSMLRGIERGTSLADYDLLIYTTQHILANSDRRSPLAENNTDGLLVFAGSLPQAELLRLSRSQFPVVLLHQTAVEGVQLPAVTVENRQGARSLVDHLIEVHGCRRIVYLEGPHEHEDSMWREQGYRASLDAHGIPFDPALIGHGGFNRHLAQAAIEKLLADNIAFDAVFAGDDDASIGVLVALREAGIAVPQDVAVVGFDDQDFTAALLPSLTTVRAPTEQVGYLAVRQLLRRIQGETVEMKLVLPTALAIRQSCGCG